MLPGLYLSMRIATAGAATPDVVDRLKVWQCAATLAYARAPRRPETPQEGRNVRNAAHPSSTRISDRALIQARLRANREGRPEPTHLFGDRRVLTVPESPRG